MATRTEFVNAMIEAFNNHGVYIGTANGEYTEALTIKQIKQKEIDYGYNKETTNKNIRRVLSYIGKCYDLGYNMENSRSGDCSGIIVGIMRDPLKMISATADYRARDFQAKSKPISLKQMIPGDFVFDKTSEAGHIGVYIGMIDNTPYVIDCRGRDVGLIKRPLSDYNWKAAGRLDWFDDEIPVLTRELRYIASDLMHGKDVEQCQNQLKKKGHNPGPIDGYYGQKTEDAVIEFQIAAELNIKRLGVVAQKTWKALFS